MVRAASDMSPRDARITDRTRSMFRAILAENCIADTDDAILEQEVVMFFKLARSHRIKLGRLGDFADCPLIIDDEDHEVPDSTTNIVRPAQLYSSSPPSPPSPTSVHSSLSSPLSSLRSSPASSPPPPSVLSPRMSLRGVSDNAANHDGIYAGMDGPNKRKRKRKPVEDVNIHGPVGESQQSAESIAQTSHPESLCADAEEATVLEGELPTATAPDGKDVSKEADLKCQIMKSIEGGMPDTLRSEDAVDVMTSVLLTAARIRIQAGRFGFEEVNLGTTTNVTKIRQYTEEWLVKQPFEVATDKIAKTGAGCAGIGLQKVWEEAFYWDIIKRHAATLESMPTTRGPHDGFTPQEKAATAKFIDLVGVGTSDENQRRCRLWWKVLSDMQNAGVVCILLYRNTKFNKYCKTFPERKHSSQQLIDTIVSWENVYSSHIKQLELRALDRARGDYTGRLDLRHESVAGILSIPDSSWNNGSNMWHSAGEETSWKLTSSSTATSTESNPSRLTTDAYIESGPNKSFFISLRPGVDKLVSVFPIIPIAAGNLLGIFAGKIRFSEHRNTAQFIPGPIPHLWLDYSQVTGTLNQMQVAPLGGEANVHLAWEGVNESVESGPIGSWRVLVLASRKIVPFEPLIRAASSEEQFGLHQSSDCARWGFLKPPSDKLASSTIQ